MNCKQGDLVRYVGRPLEQNPNCYGWVGRIVGSGSDVVGSYWAVEPRLTINYRKGPFVVYGDRVSDELLRPIRDQEGDDETLSWVGKPEKVEA